MKYVRVELFLCDCIKCDSTKKLGCLDLYFIVVIFSKHKTAILNRNVNDKTWYLVYIFMTLGYKCIVSMLKDPNIDSRIEMELIRNPSIHPACQLPNIHFE